jgi:hypothetical protein
VEPDGGHEKQPERERDQSGARERTEWTTDSKSGYDGKDGDRESEQSVAEGVLQVSSGAVLVGHAENN